MHGQCLILVGKKRKFISRVYDGMYFKKLLFRDTPRFQCPLDVAFVDFGAMPKTDIVSKSKLNIGLQIRYRLRNENSSCFEIPVLTEYAQCDRYSKLCDKRLSGYSYDIPTRVLILSWQNLSHGIYKPFSLHSG